MTKKRIFEFKISSAGINISLNDFICAMNKNELEELDYQFVSPFYALQHRAAEHEAENILKRIMA